MALGSEQTISAIDELRQAKGGVPVVVASRSADGGFAGHRVPSFLSAVGQDEDSEDAAENVERQDEDADGEDDIGEDPSSWSGILARFPKFLEAYPLACAFEADAPDEIAAIQKACEEENKQRESPNAEDRTSAGAGRGRMSQHVRTGSTTASSGSSMPRNMEHPSDEVASAWVEVQRAREYLRQREADVYTREANVTRAETRNMTTAQQLKELGCRLDAYGRELERGARHLKVRSARSQDPWRLEQRSRGGYSASAWGPDHRYCASQAY